MVKSNYDYMRRALFLAVESHKSGNGPFGAIVVKGSEIIAESQNSVHSDADCTQHAELSVIQKACNALHTEDLRNCILYTSCEPCMMCLVIHQMKAEDGANLI